MTLPAIAAFRQADQGGGQAVEGDVLRLDQQVGREAVGGQQLQGPLESACVVDERSDHVELVQDEAVRVERGRFDAGADQSQGAAPP